MTSMEVALAVAPIIIGQLLLLLMKKREMDRLNDHGVESFSGIVQKVGARTLDHILFIAGHILLLSGLVTIAFATHEWYSWLATPLLLWVSNDLLKGIRNQ